MEAPEKIRVIAAPESYLSRAGFSYRQYTLSHVFGTIDVETEIERYPHRHPSEQPASGDVLA
jgi:hypothetical protein